MLEQRFGGSYGYACKGRDNVLIRSRNCRMNPPCPSASRDRATKQTPASGRRGSERADWTPKGAEVARRSSPPRSRTPPRLRPGIRVGGEGRCDFGHASAYGVLDRCTTRPSSSRASVTALSRSESLRASSTGRMMRRESPTGELSRTSDTITSVGAPGSTDATWARTGRIRTSGGYGTSVCEHEVLLAAREASR